MALQARYGSVLWDKERGTKSSLYQVSLVTGVITETGVTVILTRTFACFT